MEIRLGTGLGGKSFVLLTGSVSSARAAVQAGIQERGNDGMITNAVVIPAPHEELTEALQ
jgi:microcompartment protein CcmL/EutN